MRLTIGMPCYNNFTEVFFTVQALRMYHNLNDCEILVIDNFGDNLLESFLKSNGGSIVRYERCTDVIGTSCAKNRVFELARGEMVLCIDSHVFLKPGALDHIPISDDLLHGPLMYNDCKNYVCEWLPIWRGQMWGVWGNNVTELPEKPFEIWGNGAGLLLTKRKTWLGYNQDFRGFGGEEGYIQEKYRRAGRKVWCYPKLVWMHMFDRKIPYPLKLADRVRNYLIGFEELGLNIKPVIEHFGEKLVEEAKNLNYPKIQTIQPKIQPVSQPIKTLQPVIPIQQIKPQSIKPQLKLPIKLPIKPPIRIQQQSTTKLPTKKLISALCITYGRPHLLEEALESFLKQDYLNKELIIVNDLAEQTLKFDHPQVKIYNFKERFKSIGEKRNKSVELSKGDILVAWDDDDISLPWRLTQIANIFNSNPNSAYFKPDKAWCFYENELKPPHYNLFYMMAAFSRKAFIDVGGYNKINFGEDTELCERIMTISNTKATVLKDEEYSFIYGWRHDSFHLSGFGKEEQNGANLEKSDSHIRKKPIESDVILKPHWRQDYLKLTKDILIKLKETKK